jgi:hypothetical protein
VFNRPVEKPNRTPRDPAASRRPQLIDMLNDPADPFESVGTVRSNKLRCLIVLQTPLNKHSDEMFTKVKGPRVLC